MRIARVQVAGELEPRFVVDEGARYREVAGAPWARVTLGARTFAYDEVVRAAPSAPSKVLCIGRNYREHAKELGNDVPVIPTVFLKPASSVAPSGAPIVRPVHLSSVVHHEGELAVVVGKRMKNVAVADALGHVFGYTCGNDVTARDLQHEDKRFTRAKGFDTFCPLGPHIVTADEIEDPQALELVVRVGGVERQRGNTRDMVFPVALLLAYCSQVMTLEPGDVVLTGTPAGVGPLVAGDVVTVEISSIGTLESTVVDGPALPPLFNRA